VTDTANKIQCMRFLFGRPSSLHDDPDELIKWGEDNLPKLFKGQVEKVVSNDTLLVELYDELIQREQSTEQADPVGGND
jgi:hypothetical protein